MSIYDIKVQDINKNSVDLSDFRGKVLLIVNVASKCKCTPQYKGLQEMYDRLHPKGLEILGFPCDQFAHQEPGTNSEIIEFCDMQYNVTFPMFDKISVNGENSHVLYQYLKKEATGFLAHTSITWNFTKFLVDQNGKVIKRFAPVTSPAKIEAYLMENFFNDKDNRSAA